MGECGVDVVLGEDHRRLDFDYVVERAVGAQQHAPLAHLVDYPPRLVGRRLEGPGGVGAAHSRDAQGAQGLARLIPALGEALLAKLNVVAGIALGLRRKQVVR